MAGIFKKAYDQADRMLNTSGISSLPVVYKDVGGRLLRGIDDAGDIIFDSNLPKDKKNELYNLLTGSELRSWQTGRAKPDTSWNKAASDFLKDIAVTATAPPGTPLSKGASMIPGLQTTTDLTRFGIRSLINNPTIRGMLGNIDTYDSSKDIKALQSELKSNPDPDLAKELKELIAIQKSQELKRKNPLSAKYALYLDQFRPDKVVDGKRSYNPITDENKSKYFSEESQKKVGQELRENLESKLKAREEGTSSGQTLKTIGDADLISSEPDSLGKVYYGSYDSRGKWQEGIPNWDGTFTVKDEYNWNRDFPVGPGAIIRSLANYTNPNTRSLKSLAESIGGTVGPIGAQGEGRKIEFNVPAYSDPVKQLDVMRLLDRPPSVSPTGDLGGSPLYQPPQSDIVEEANKLGVPVIDVEQPGLPGMGWHHEAFDDPDDFTEQYTDYHTGLKHGGQTMSRGLSGINKTININGQPHSLAWINPGEASALRAMGGSGKPGPMGIPSYQDELYDYEDEYEIGTGGEFGVTSTPATSTYVAGLGVGGDPAYQDELYDPWQEERAEIIKRSGTGGGRSEIDPRLDPVIKRTMDTGEPPRLSYVRQTYQDVQDILKGMSPEEREGQDERGLFVKTLQERFPDLEKQFDLEGFIDDYKLWLPGAIPLKLFGGLMGLLRGKTSPIVGTIMVHGEKKNIHADGSISDPIEGADYEGGDNEPPIKKKFPLKKITAAGKEEEKELAGMAAHLAKRKPKPTEVEALLPQFKTIVAAGFSEQEAADMLGVSLADMLDASSDTFIT